MTTHVTVSGGHVKVWTESDAEVAPAESMTRYR